MFGIILLLVIEHGVNAFLAGPPHKHEHEAAAKDVESPAEPVHREDGHGHACMTHASTASWLKSAPVTSGTVRAQVSCCCRRRTSWRRIGRKGAGCSMLLPTGRAIVCATASTCRQPSRGLPRTPCVLPYPPHAAARPSLPLPAHSRCWLT
jgi:hypothetical protein